MLTPSEALDLVIRTADVLPAAECAVGDACGRMLAQALVAEDDRPPFSRAMMDGFAVRVADAGRTVPVVGEIPAGSTWEGTIADGQCVAILTGAPCAVGAEAVVPKEQTRREGASVVLPDSIVLGQFIARPGSDCIRGQCVLPAGMQLSPLAIAALVALGKTRVLVVPRPRLVIITTGGELVSDNAPQRPGQICDSNSPMLAAMAASLGLSPPTRLHARDVSSELARALEQSADADVVVLSGGVSVGTYDLVPQTLAHIGAETLFHGVSQKPGKPLLFARRRRQLIFGLPGNPLASHLGFHRYVSAAIRKLSGFDPRPRSFRGVLAAPIAPDGGRTLFLPARAEPGTESSARWRILPLPMASSADIFHSCPANCYVEVPPRGHTLVAQEECLATWMDGAMPFEDHPNHQHFNS